MTNLTLLDAAQRSGPVAKKKKWIQGAAPESPKSGFKAKAKDSGDSRKTDGKQRRGLQYKSMEKK